MRGQTTLDFAIGVTIFLAVLLFAFGFVPGIFEPFEVSGEEEPVVSDRVGNTLTSEMLGSPQQPHVLDRYCTVAFFNDSDAAGGCEFDGTAAVTERFNLDTAQSLNVTIVENFDTSTADAEQLCWWQGGAEPTLTDMSQCSGDPHVRLAIGDVPPTGATTITARRVVSLDGETVRMRVVVW